MLNNQKDKLFSKKVIETFLENEYKSSIKKNDKFSELAFSIAYYLKSFSNIKKLLDYICLIFKHIFDQTLIIIIPLNEKGEIWNENIRISANIEFLQAEIAINSFLKKFNFSKNFKLKEIETFEQDLKNNFKEYNIESEKILSRGKCRGFIYIFNNLISTKTILDDQIFNFIKNCLAIGLENYWLIKTKKRHENVDREISTGAEIQSQLLPDFCPTIFGLDLAAHCRPALQLGGDYFDFMSLKPNCSDKRKEKSKVG